MKISVFLFFSLWALVGSDGRPLPQGKVYADGGAFANIGPGKADVGAAKAYGAQFGGRANVFFDNTVGTKFHSPLGGFGKRIRIRKFADVWRKGAVAYGAGFRNRVAVAPEVAKGAIYGGPKAAAVYGNRLGIARGANAYAYGDVTDMGGARLGKKIDVDTYRYGIFGDGRHAKHTERLRNAGYGRRQAFANENGINQAAVLDNAGAVQAAVAGGVGGKVP